MYLKNANINTRILYQNWVVVSYKVVDLLYYSSYFFEKAVVVGNYIFLVEKL